MVLPLLVLIPLSFNSSRFIEFPPKGFSTHWVEQLLNVNSGWPSAAFNSLVVAFASTLIAVVLGCLSAFGLSKVPRRFGKFIRLSLVLPLVTPSIVLAVALYRVLLSLGLIDTLAGLALAHALIALPFVVLIIGPVVQQIDRTLESAARNLGAKPATIFLKVILPIVRPSLMVSAALAFAHSITDVVLTIFLTDFNVITLSRKMWDGFKLEISPDLAAVSIVSFVVSLITILVVYRLLRISDRRPA